MNKSFSGNFKAQTSAVMSARMQAVSRLSTVRKQRGAFDPITIIAVLVVIAVLASLVASQFSGDSAKAVALLNNMATISDATNRAKLDMGGIPTKITTLWRKGTAAPQVPLYGGVNGDNSWNGPYLDTQPQGTSDFFMAGRTIADAVQLSINDGTGAAAPTINGAFGASTRLYWVQATLVPRGIALEVVKKCNGVEATATGVNAVGTPQVALLNNRCGVADAAAETTTVYYKVAEAR